MRPEQLLLQLRHSHKQQRCPRVGMGAEQIIPWLVPDLIRSSMLLPPWSAKWPSSPLGRRQIGES